MYKAEIPAGQQGHFHEEEDKEPSSDQLTMGEDT